MISIERIIDEEDKSWFISVKIKGQKYYLELFDDDDPDEDQVMFTKINPDGVKHHSGTPFGISKKINEIINSMKDT